MLLLSKKKYAKKARYGYVNGKEPVNYVRDIRQRFEAYIDLSGAIAQVPSRRPEHIYRTRTVAVRPRFSTVSSDISFTFPPDIL
jgi:membrane-bound lytic murein transglycosylase MltF